MCYLIEDLVSFQEKIITFALMNSWSNGELAQIFCIKAP